MRLATIASGSSGNCIYIGTEGRNIIVDAGIPLRRIEQGLGQLGLEVEDLDAVFVSHEHSDHIGGLGVLLRRHAIPVFLSEGTYEAIAQGRMLGSVPEDVFMPFKPGGSFGFGDITVCPIPVTHDAAQPVIYRFDSGESSCAVVTDLGNYDEAIAEKLQGLGALVLEANHDLRMLQAGPYPYQTKRRIVSDLGHLSNETAGRLLVRLMNPSLKKVILGHISKTNNYPDLAYKAVHMELAFLDDCPAELYIAPPSGLSEVVEF